MTLASAADTGSPPAVRTTLSPAAVHAVAAALLVCVLAVVSIQTTRSVGLVASLWLSGGVAAAAWVLAPAGRRFDGAYALTTAAAFATANVLVGNTLVQTAVFTLGNMIEVAAAVWLIRRFSPDLNLSALSGVTRFLLAAPVLAPIPAGLFVALALGVDGGGVRHAFETWWFGHALGLATVTTFVVALRRGDWSEFARPARLAEAAVLFAALLGATAVVFLQDARPITFLITPALLLVTVRLRLAGAATGILCVAVLAILATLAGRGPFHLATGGLDEHVRLAQLYLIFGCLPMLPVAALLAERDALAEAARRGQARAEAGSAAKSRLLANVSHEIKSPIAGVIGIGELWSGGALGPVSPKQAEMSAMLVSTARQIEALAGDLLDVAKAESGSVSVRLGPVNLACLVEDARKTLALRPDGAGVSLRVEQEGDFDFVARADSVRTAQVIDNLAVNAVKYGAAGGVVIFRLSRPEPDRVRLEVIDHGPGISAEKREELFEPFNRLGMEKSQIEGHGIGLALAKRLTELQGGAIGVDSAPGKGARFWIDLPAHAAEAA